MSNLVLSIYSPDRKLIEKTQVKGVSLTGSEGLLEILPGHAPMMGTLAAGPFSYEAVGSGSVLGVISHGFFKIENDEVLLLADTLELSTEIDSSRAKAAQLKAENALNSPELTEANFNKYERKLQRAVIRQQIAGQSNTTNH